jgi:hypothetical protein
MEWTVPQKFISNQRDIQLHRGGLPLLSDGVAE